VTAGKLENTMSKSKFFTLVLVSGGFVAALGINCIPNLGSVFGTLNAFFGV
jgi:hypothetical protein